MDCAVLSPTQRLKYGLVAGYEIDLHTPVTRDRSFLSIDHIFYLVQLLPYSIHMEYLKIHNPRQCYAEEWALHAQQIGQTPDGVLSLCFRLPPKL
jgi:hypothetical protein